MRLRVAAKRGTNETQPGQSIGIADAQLLRIQNGSGVGSIAQCQRLGQLNELLFLQRQSRHSLVATPDAAQGFGSCFCQCDADERIEPCAFAARGSGTRQGIPQHLLCLATELSALVGVHELPPGLPQQPEQLLGEQLVGFALQDTLSNFAAGMLVLIYVIEPGDFQHWLGVEEIMRAEATEEAEAALAKISAHVREYAGIEPETSIREGKTTEQIHSLIEEDQDIAIMVLAAGSAKEGPGPLVSSIAGRGAAFPIPVTIIPDTLSDEDIDALC